MSNLARKYTGSMNFTAGIVYTAMVYWHFHTLYTGKIFGSHAETALLWSRSVVKSFIKNSIGCKDQCSFCCHLRETTIQKLDLDNLPFYWIYRWIHDRKSERSYAFFINLLPNWKFNIPTHDWISSCIGRYRCFYLGYSKSHYKQCCLQK